MSRLDFVILGGAEPELHRIRWGAPTLLATLLPGPEEACATIRELADAIDAPKEDGLEILDNIAAGCIVDLARKRLVVSGSAAAISRDDLPRRLIAQEVLPALAATWPGWQLEYGPEHVCGALELYLHARELAPPAVTPIRCTAYALDTGVLEDGEPVLRERAFYVDALLLESAEVAALNAAGIEEIRDLCGLGDRELAARGISEALRHRLRDELAGWFFTE